MRMHFTSEPFELDFEKKYKQQRVFKPSGLWYSVEGSEDSWSTWCMGEGFRMENLEFQYKIELDKSRILFIKTVEELDAFHSRFYYSRYTFVNVCWDRVAENYSGIEIAPYQWSRRLSLDGGYDWYYGWDCASGCVWDLSAITEFKLHNDLKLSQKNT
jgi:hypothetical protein